MAAPEDFHDISNKLAWKLDLKTTSEETLARSAISRAYYAGFHVLQECVRKHTGKPAYRVTHEGLITYLSSCKGETLNAVHETMLRAKRLRHRSDYHLHEEVGLNVAKTTVRDIKDLVVDKSNDILKSMLNETATLPVNAAQ